MLIKDFFTSGWEFTKEESELKNRFEMINIAIILSTIGVVYGLILNFYQGFYPLAKYEFSLIMTNIVLWFMLRKSKDLYDIVAFLVTAQFSLLLILLIYVSPPDAMKHTWFFTYPVIILYLRNEKHAIPWFIFLIVMILIAPFQPFFPVQYSFFQLFYLSFVLIVVSIIVYFYKIKMDAARKIISTQEQQLLKKIDELTQKDKMLTQQSKQAVMGEMISMIAHQWRQPLSTVTLSISNLQVKKLLGEQISEKDVDEVLKTVSDTVVYLSDTIDDFKTYFQPNKELQRVTITEIIDKTLTFVEPRMKNRNITLLQHIHSTKELYTYSNELVQVLLNIINNAIDEFIVRNTQNPQIDISVLDDTQDAIIIVIEDNAGGIKQQNIDTIFEPYVSTKGKNGTGLGLYMSQMIIEKQFNSKIEVQTNSIGATFRIRIPIKLA